MVDRKRFTTQNSGSDCIDLLESSDIDLNLENDIVRFSDAEPSKTNDIGCEHDSSITRQSRRDMDRSLTVQELAKNSRKSSCVNGIGNAEMFLNWTAISIAAYLGAYVRIGFSNIKIWCLISLSPRRGGEG